MATSSTKGRSQDRSKVAGGQDHEVGYEQRKMKTTGKAVKAAVAAVGNSRSKVEKKLKKK